MMLNTMPLKKLECLSKANIFSISKGAYPCIPLWHQNKLECIFSIDLICKKGAYSCITLHYLNKLECLPKASVFSLWHHLLERYLLMDNNLSKPDCLSKTNIFSFNLICKKGAYSCTALSHINKLVRLLKASIFSMNLIWQVHTHALNLMLLDT